jgi:hypothetical protein
VIFLLSGVSKGVIVRLQLESKSIADRKQGITTRERAWQRTGNMEYLLQFLFYGAVAGGALVIIVLGGYFIHRILYPLFKWWWEVFLPAALGVAILFVIGAGVYALILNFIG